MKNSLVLDEMDLEFIMGVQDCLDEVLLKSSFLKRLQEDSDYVYHYDEQYWAQVIKNEFDSRHAVIL
ncbi:hypothetical protein [Aneurinibacillus tyrosinisolvens]|uniref:hypothetical protein n=1 Tax=Aneurinibacillus tyrosinisolvens TaxID=1443435 RepID=UPI00063F7BB7|nr:hypothetical protein [Aneurinibacillus tyrosinisolvens]